MYLVSLAICIKSMKSLYINNLRYEDDTTLMAESEVELKKRGMLQSMGLHELDKTG